MYEDAVILPVPGARIYAYGLLLALGCWLAIILLWRLSSRHERLSQAAAFTSLLALPMGFALARAMYCLLDSAFQPILTLRNLLNVHTGGFAMYGALLGAALSALIGARLAGANKMRMLDLLSPALAAFLVPARLGEGFTTLGISRPLTTSWLADSFLASRDAYDSYLRTYLLEAATALILAVFLIRMLRRNVKEGLVFSSFCLLYGVTQTLMESLRYDGHLRFGFIGVQQVLSAALFGVTLIALSVRALRRQGGKLLPVIALASLPLVLAALVGVEFLIDRSALGKLFSYGLYLPLLALPATLGMRLIKGEEGLG